MKTSTSKTWKEAKLKMPPTTRRYLMALFAKRRKPIRVSKAQWISARAQSTEWWEVLAPSASAARELCLAWPMKATDGAARIVDHGRNKR